MDRLISQFEVIRAIEKYVDNIFTKNMGDLINDIKAISSAEPKWIPIFERLPEKHGNYFVTLIDKDYSDNKICTMQIAYWTGLKWELDFEECNSIIAWMPLPKPYEQQERSE